MKINYYNHIACEACYQNEIHQLGLTLYEAFNLYVFSLEQRMIILDKCLDALDAGFINIHILFDGTVTKKWPKRFY